MSEAAPQGVDRLPTLTEVVEMGQGDEAHVDDAAPTLAPAPLLQEEQLPPVAQGAVQVQVPAPHETGVLQPDVGAIVLDQQALITQVLAEMNPRIDMLFQSRLREALAPALARAADVLIRDARDEMSASLRELVQDAVARALQRRSGD